MNIAVQKITLSPSRDIPFNKLILSQSNVRRVKAGMTIEELAASIARRGLLQSLNVRPVLDADGKETGMFEIPAGGRRYRALEMLVKQKRLAKTAPVPCVVSNRVSVILAEEDSLAENIERASLHPLDQFRAFQDMRQKGQSEEEIAAAFFVSVNVVKQRLRLATVSPVLLDTYAEDGMTLEQLMAFTVSSDHARQEQVWETIQRSWSKEPYHIRRMMTENTVSASGKRMQFVGIEAYEAAGGTMLRDLFQSDNGGWVENVALLDKLVTARLQAVADEIANEGWKWVEAAVNLPYDANYGMRELAGEPKDMTPEEQAAIDALEAEQAKLEEEYQDHDELPEEIDERLGEIEAVLKRFEARPLTFDPAEIGRAGVFVSIDGDGTLLVERGYVRPEDEVPVAGDGDDDLDAGDERVGSGDGHSSQAGHQRAVITIGGRPSEPEEEDEGDAAKPLPERLVSELTAHRTLALRDAVANNPHVAMTVLLHKLVLDTFQRSSSTASCLEASVRHVFFPVQAADLKESPSAKGIDERQEAWTADIPLNDDQVLWDWIDALDNASRLALLAHCVSYGVNALYEKVDRYGGGGISAHGIEQRLKQADRLAAAVGLDMVEVGWMPTVDNYLGRVTKLRILEAVREAKGEQAAQLIDHLKKADMAKEAERLLSGAGWLPEPLRLVQAHEQRSEEADGPDSVEALPDFLASEDEETAGGPGVEPSDLIAAE